MRRVSMATREELVKAVTERYARSERPEKSRILDEFVAVSGFHRKHVMRLLRNGPQKDGPSHDRTADFMTMPFVKRWLLSGRLRIASVANG